MKISVTKIVGKYQHVIRLYFPCNNMTDVRGPHGTAPIVHQLVEALQEHLKDCEECEK